MLLGLLFKMNRITIIRSMKKNFLLPTKNDEPKPFITIIKSNKTHKKYHEKLCLYIF